MDEERQTSIANALQRYRETVLQQNLVVLRFLVEAMEEQPDPPRWPAGLAQKQRLKAFDRWYLMGCVPESVSSARDLLSDDVHSELVSTAELNGVSYAAVDLQQRMEWFATIRARIAEKNVVADEFPPADLEYVCTLVNGICGPGLPYHREQQQFEFVSSLELEVPDWTAARVTVPIRDDEEGFNDLTYVWEDWEIAVAVKTGVGPRDWGGCYALFCRNESHERWQWRYGVHDGDWRSYVYDTVEDFLEFYAHFGEQTDESARKDVKSLKAMI